jgi:hypothetical protein
MKPASVPSLVLALILILTAWSSGKGLGKTNG